MFNLSCLKNFETFKRTNQIHHPNNSLKINKTFK